MKFITSLICNIGGRNKNDDYAAYNYEDESYGIWTVADGLGGHKGGDIASKIAVNTIIKYFKAKPDLSKKNVEAMYNYANKAIIKAQKEYMIKYGMKTTLVTLLNNYEEVIWAHVGDSRLYFFSKGRLMFQTKDHSVSQMAVSAGEISEKEIRFHEDRNKLIRVLGNTTELKISMLKRPIKVNSGDAFLLCTDGFWELIYETEMEIDFCKSNSPGEWLNFMTERIIRRAFNEYDNFTAIAIFVE